MDWLEILSDVWLYRESCNVYAVRGRNGLLIVGELSITPSGSCRRQPFAVELIADGQPFGQVADALMTVGGEEF